jgi:hypothetical protein
MYTREFLFESFIILKSYEPKHQYSPTSQRCEQVKKQVCPMVALMVGLVRDFALV